MYLTRMELDTAKRKTIMAMALPALFHGTVERSFTEKGGKLWRLDALSGNTYLLLVSNERPDLTAAAEQFGTEKGWETQNYDIFLSNIKEGDRRGFRLKANPVITKSAGTGNHGKVLAHLTTTQQKQWLFERSERNGFYIKLSEFEVVQNTWESFRKGTDGGKHVTFRTATFEGTLTVTDSKLFCRTLLYGLGREKAYGCGMMTVTRHVQ